MLKARSEPGTGSSSHPWAQCPSPPPARTWCGKDSGALCRRWVTGPAAWVSSLTTLPPHSASEGFLEASGTAGSILLANASNSDDSDPDSYKRRTKLWQLHHRCHPPLQLCLGEGRSLRTSAREGPDLAGPRPPTCRRAGAAAARRQRTSPRMSPCCPA